MTCSIISIIFFCKFALISHQHNRQDNFIQLIAFLWLTGRSLLGSAPLPLLPSEKILGKRLNKLPDNHKKKIELMPLFWQNPGYAPAWITWKFKHIYNRAMRSKSILIRRVIFESLKCIERYVHRVNSMNMIYCALTW